MTTFSQLVDDIITEVKRPDLTSVVATYLNQTIREVHFTPDRNAALFYRENYREQLLTATGDSLTWDIPDPTNFQKMAAVRYSSQFNRSNESIWAVETTPGRHLRDLDYYFYRVGGGYSFSGFGGLNSQVAIGWFEFPRTLKYKAVAARVATYDVETGWSYPVEVNTPELELAAQALSTNWLLLRWGQILAEGLRAKVYKRLADTERARTCYSLYGSLRQGLWTSETAESGVY